MSSFGQTLFEGTGFIRWTLTPFVLVFAILMPLLMDGGTPTRVLWMVGIELICVALLAGFWLPARAGRWAFRVLGGLVFLAYAAYVVDEFFFSTTPFTVSGRRSDASPFNALLGFLLIGGPGLWYAVLGRFTLRPPPEPGPEEHRLESDDDDT